MNDALNENDRTRTMAGVARTRRESGAALLIAMLMMAMLAAIGLASINTVGLDQQVAHYQSGQRMAFYAAEAGISEALSELLRTGTPTVGNMAVGDAVIYPHGQPSYQADPTVAVPLEEIGTGAVDDMNMKINAGGTSTYTMQYWRVRVQGTSPSGATSRMEAVAGRIAGS
jgi:Tfp pilus assembly protein PilX